MSQPGVGRATAFALAGFLLGSLITVVIRYFQNLSPLYDPSVSIVLSGMSTVAQVDENVASADRSGPGALSADEVRLVESVAAAFKGLQPIPCTECSYCMPCPNGVDIPFNLANYNSATMFNRLDQVRNEYGQAKEKRKSTAGFCTDCGQCEPRCPQKIPISDWMPRIERELGTGATKPTES